MKVWNLINNQTTKTFCTNTRNTYYHIFRSIGRKKSRHLIDVVIPISIEIKILIKEWTIQRFFHLCIRIRLRLNSFDDIAFFDKIPIHLCGIKINFRAFFVCKFFYLFIVIVYQRRNALSNSFIFRIIYPCVSVSFNSTRKIFENLRQIPLEISPCPGI